MVDPDAFPLTDETKRTYGTAEAYVHARYGVPPEELRELIRTLAADEVIRALQSVSEHGRYKP